MSLEQKFITSIMYNQLDQVKNYIQNGVSVHYMNNKALRLASQYGYYDIVKYLIHCGAKVCKYSFILACEVSFETAKYLYKFIEVTQNILDDALIRACCSSYVGNLQIAKWLYKLGGNIHTQNDCIIRWAYLYGNPLLIKWLLSIDIYKIKTKYDFDHIFASYGYNSSIFSTIKEVFDKDISSIIDGYYKI